MKKMRLVLLGFVLMLAGATSAYARDSFSFGLNIGGPAYYGPPPAVYYQPAPPVVYYPAPGYYNHYYAPRAYYRPYYAPRPYYNHGPRGGWDDRRGGHR
jgi:hypothetical protein